MIKLMIVDDEAMIRQGLRQSIHWEEHGVVIVGEARSGNAALEKAMLLRPDIVISDIRMAEGDGLRLAKQLTQALPQVRIIMLSGYSDMDYMIEAIKLGVRDYLLKPAGASQILQSVQKLRDEILDDQRREQQSSRMENLINENLDTLKAYFLDELLEGRLSSDVALEKARSLQLPLPGPYYSLLVAVPQPGRGFELLQTISSLLEDYTPALTERDNRVTAILNVSNALSASELLFVAQRVRPLLEPVLLTCVGAPCTLEELGALHAACVETAMRSPWFTAPYLTAQLSTTFPALPESELRVAERNIVGALRCGNHTLYAQEVDALFVLLEANRPSTKQLWEVLIGIARSIQMFSENNSLMLQLKALRTQAYSVDVLHKALLSLFDSDYAEYGPQIKHALTFIAGHYMDELSLSDVAGALYISPSYLTRLLKGKTGRGFNDWLHFMRIEKAKELLRDSDLRHYEIAERVGYRSYKIFSEYFAKFTGSSARSYREGLYESPSTQKTPSG